MTNIKEDIYKSLGIITESNATRRKETRWGKEAYILNQKSIPMKRRIINNDASKKLVASWEKNLRKKDATGKILLDPTPKMYGGHGAYGVWLSCKGVEDMYADIKTIDGEKWSFSECFLSEKGAKKLENNIVPTQGDFYEGDDAMFNGYHNSRRKAALQYKQKNPMELEKDSKRISNLKKEMWSPNFDWKNAEKIDKERDEIESKYNRKIEYGNHDNRSKKERKETHLSRYFYKVIDSLKPFEVSSDSKQVDKSRSLNDKAWNLYKDYEDKKITIEEYGKKLAEIKKEIEDFVKSNKPTYFKY